MKDTLVTGKPLTEHFLVAPQVGLEEIPMIAEAGIRGLINNRPDGEAPDQPTSAALAAAASRAGLAYRHLPVVPGAIDERQVAAFAQALSDMPGPVLAFCRTGTRSASLWALAAAREGQPVEDILRRVGRAGYDLAALRPRLHAAAPR